MGFYSPPYQVWKNTYIFIINNSVTHLWSYTNTTNADIEETLCQYRRKLHASADVSAPGSDVSALIADIVASNGECLSVS